MSVIVFDLDGVLADTRHRDHHITGPGKKDWEAYYLAAGEDSLVHNRASLLTVLEEEFTIFIATGRVHRISGITEKWLRQHDISYARIKYRDDNDFTKNEKLKLFMAQEWIEEGFEIALWVDDNPKVAYELEKVGVPVLEVKPVRSILPTQG